MGIKDKMTGSAGSFIFNLVFRFLQLVFGVAVIGLYAQDLNKAHKEGKYTDSKWVYAVVVSTLSSITAIVYAIPFIKSYILAPWDFVLFILWCALFGIFGKMYIHENAEMSSGIKRMKNAVWIDLVNLLLWFFSAIVGCVLFFKWLKGGRTTHTGRATV